MADKGKLETVPEHPEITKTPAPETYQNVPEGKPVKTTKVTARTVVVDIQLPIVTDVGPSRENSAKELGDGKSGDAIDGKSKDVNNNQEFLDSAPTNGAKGGIYNAFTRTDTILSKVSSVGLPSPPRHSARKSKSAKKQQARSKSSQGFSKRELELFLPRKTFYSAHDKELRDAGHQIDSSEQNKKPDWRRILKMHTMEELYPPDIEPEEVKPGFHMDNESDEEDEVEGNLLENVQTAMSGGMDAPVHRHRRTKKKQLSHEKEEYKPLYEYLKYIQDHPDEYKTMSKYTPKNTDYRHPNQIVRLGRVYRRWHHGTLKTSVYLHAVNGLKTTPEPETRRGQVTRRENADGGDSTPIQDESEIEKLKNKTEKWLRSLPTQQILRVKELALKDIGDEDTNVSKWWLTFRSCHYIRLPQHLTPV